MNIRENTSISNHYAPIYKLLIIAVFIFAMQFCDSFSTELFGKLQSLYTTDFLILGKGMSEQTALAYLSTLNLPFLVMSWLAPLGKILVDVLGRNRMYLINIVCMLLGCALCFFAPNLIVFLLGNAVLTFSYSLDIQYIYIVEEVSPRHRATVRGLTSGISAIASMLLPVVRGLCISRLGLTWKYLYAVAGCLCVLLILTSVLLLLRLSAVRSSHTQLSSADAQTPAVDAFSADTLPADSDPAQKRVSSSFLQKLRSFLAAIISSPRFRQLALPLLFAGAATAGISFYNEPLLSFSSRSELSVDAVMMIQPIVLLLTSVLYGFLADHTNRRRVLILCTILAGFTLILYCITAETTIAVLLPGVLWGLMYGSYYTLIDLMQLMIIELAPTGSAGKFSAIAVFIYGFGDAVGMLLVSLLVGSLGMTVSKLALGLPFLIVSCILLIVYTKNAPEAPDTHPAC